MSGTFCKTWLALKSVHILIPRRVPLPHIPLHRETRLKTEAKYPVH